VKSEFKTVKSETIYDGKIVRLDVDTIESPSGQLMKREVVKHMDAVGVIAITSDGRIVLVSQYRHAIGKNILEVPAGLLDNAGESAEDCTIRELKEETGYSASKVEEVCGFYTSAGFSDEKLYLYYAYDIQPGEHAREADEEGMSVVEIDLDEAYQMVKQGEIEDSKTIIAILMAMQDRNCNSSKS
jgi:ADP-ribose pyrophosphatase